MKYVCDLCGWEYDEEQGYPEGGIAPGTKWEDVPEDFEDVSEEVLFVEEVVDAEAEVFSFFISERVTVLLGITNVISIVMIV